MDRDKVASRQEKIRKRIECSKKKRIREATGILKEIRSYSEEDARYAMGVFGVKLKRFSSYVDLTHPDLSNLFNGALVGRREGSFSKSASDLLKLAAYGRQWDLSPKVLENLKRVISNHTVYKTLRTNIDSPTANLQHLRFVEDEELRNSCRSLKSSQPVPYRHGIWEHEDFRAYYRNSNRYADCIQFAERKKKRMSEFGLSNMVATIDDAIADFKKTSEKNQYCGFNRISLSEAAFILSKCNDFRVRESQKHDSGIGEKGYVVYAKRSKFSQYKFCAGSNLKYRPMLHTLDGMSVPDGVKEIIDLLEEYPEVGNKPLFDHYKAFVPSMAFNDVTDRMCLSGDQKQKEHDSVLLDDGVITAILLGERDGSHYFISYWV